MFINYTKYIYVLPMNQFDTLFCHLISGPTIAHQGLMPLSDPRGCSLGSLICLAGVHISQRSFHWHWGPLSDNNRQNYLLVSLLFCFQNKMIWNASAQLVLSTHFTVWRFTYWALANFSKHFLIFVLGGKLMKSPRQTKPVGRKKESRVGGWWRSCSSSQW